MRINDVKTLEGQEMSFMELDNVMIALGYHTVFGRGAEQDIHDNDIESFILKIAEIVGRE